MMNSGSAYIKDHITGAVTDRWKDIIGMKKSL